jgi:signal transduction histidine kinase
MKLSVKISLLVGVSMVLAIGVSGGAAYLLSNAATSAPLILVAALTITVGLAVATVWILTRQLTRPIQALSAAVSRIALGDLSQEVPVRSSDELGVLSRRFSEMTQQLSGSYRSLETSMHEARARRAELESSINGLRQGFILTDGKLDVLLANAAATSIIHGDEPAAHKGNAAITLAAIEHALPADLELKAKITETLQHGKLTKYPDLPLHGRFLNLYLSPVLDEGKATGCVLLLEDVTEERIIARSRDEFFSIASHELRTPLTAIRGNASMMKQYFPEVVKDPDVKEMIDDIQESAVRLIDIVNDFLDTSRLEQGKMKFEPAVFSLEPIIEKIIYEMSGLSRSKHITIGFDQLTLGKLPMLYADPSRITQVVYNLLGNAMKFTEDGSVMIACTSEKQYVKVSVSDTGIGISPEGQQILFHKFQQSTASTLTRDNTRGTGLGLYISKLMLEHMGGAIKLEHSEMGKGSTFSFTVPVATPAQLKQAKPISTVTAKASHAA